MRACTSGDMLLPPEGHAALAAVPGLDVDLRVVKAAHLCWQPLARRRVVLQGIGQHSAVVTYCLQWQSGLPV